MAGRRRTNKKPESDSPVAGLGERKNLSPITHFLSTGCTILDLAITDDLPGGFPGGRITHIYGLESAAKTIFATEPLGSAQRQGGKAFFEDAEHTLDFDRLELFGVDCGADPLEDKKNWCYGTPNSIEELFDVEIQSAIDDCDNKKPNAMAVDSLSALSSEKELEAKLTDASYGTSRAKKMSEAFRKFLRSLSEANLALIFVDQSRQGLDPYGPKEVVSGGLALKFYSSVRIHMAVEKRIYEREKGPVVGVWFKFEVVKNKVGPPLRAGRVAVIFNYGVDDIRTNIEFLKTTGEGTEFATLACKECPHTIQVKKETRATKKKCPKCGGVLRKLRGGGGYEFCNQSFKSMAAAIEWVEKNEADEILAKEVREHWRLMHQTQERKLKPRRRN